MVARGRAELLEFFDEQIGFLERSNRTFDKGHFSEAKRMATTLRVLCHNTGRSRSVIHQLDFNDTLTWVDTPEWSSPLTTRLDLAPSGGVGLRGG